MITTIVFSICGVLTGSKIVKQTGHYKAFLTEFTLGFLITMGVWFFVIKLDIGWTLYAVLGTLGFLIGPCLTIGIEFSCEIGYPVGEAYSNGMI